MGERSVTLIRPNLGNYRSSDAMPPLSLAILAARTPPDIEVRFHDERLAPLPQDDTPGLVAITVETFTARRAYEIADQYRARGIPVVMGGYHPTFVPKESLGHAESVVVGDAEGVWEQLLDDHFRGGGLQRTYIADEKRPLNDIVHERQIFSGKKYPPVDLVWFSRGCRFACDFCSIRAFYKKGVRFRPVESVVQEIEEMGASRLVFFVDDNLFVSPAAFEELLDALECMKVRWTCQVSIDVARDERLLDKMAKSGCAIALIGFESLSPGNLRQMGKRWNNVAGDYATVVRKFRERGISVYGTFVFGYDADTLESMEDALSFALETRLDIANFNPLTPTPATALYDRLEKEGRMLKPKWWLDPEYRYGDAIFRPKLMDPVAFSQKCFEMRTRFYSLPSIADRLVRIGVSRQWDRLRTIGFINMVSRKEIASKQRRHLGSAE